METLRIASLLASFEATNLPVNYSFGHGDKGLPNSFRQDRPSVNDHGQVGVDLTLSRRLSLGRFFLSGYMLEYMR
jgi:hypothetical protein